MRRKAIGVILFALVCINLLVPNQQAQAEVCPVYNFQSIFFEEYYPGTKWDNRSGNRSISWSANGSVIYDESVTRSFTLEELDWIQSAFQSWDDALDSVTFTETPQSAQAEIVIGYVTLISAANQPGATGYWNAWWNDNWRNRATIKLKVGNTSWFSVKSQFIHAVQHELGNVLGLGDIKPTYDFASTQEDSWQPPYGPVPLSDYDTGMIRQLYGESTCPSTFPNAAAKAAAELKAKQEAEAAAAKAAAELKAKQEAELKAKQEAEAKAAVELKAKQEAEAKAAAELKAKQEAEAKAAAELKAKQEAEAKAAAELKAKQEAEAKAAAELKAKQEAEAKAAAELKAKQEAEARAAAELKAKQELEARIAADLKAKQEAETKAAATRKTTITCVKGKLSKKITAVKPKCPSGYKIKK